MKPLPDTSCPLCYEAELSLSQWAGERLKAVWRGFWGYPPGIFQQSALHYSSMIRLFQGRPERTWLERHRDAYVETGDPMELIRMERHIERERR